MLRCKPEYLATAVLAQFTCAEIHLERAEANHSSYRMTFPAARTVPLDGWPKLANWLKRQEGPRSNLKNTSARWKQGADGSLKRPLRGTRPAARARDYNRLKDLFMAAEALAQASLNDLARRAALKGSG